MILISSRPNIELAVGLCVENERFSVGIACKSAIEKKVLIGHINLALKHRYKGVSPQKKKSEGGYSVVFKNGSHIRLVPSDTDARGQRYNALLVPADVDAQALYTRLLPQHISYYPFRR